MNKEREPGWWFEAYDGTKAWSFGPFSTFEEVAENVLGRKCEGYSCGTPNFVGPKLPEVK